MSLCHSVCLYVLGVYAVSGTVQGVGDTETMQQWSVSLSIEWRNTAFCFVMKWHSISKYNLTKFPVAFKGGCFFPS